jgi:hypothetical protein
MRNKMMSMPGKATSFADVFNYITK